MPRNDFLDYSDKTVKRKRVVRALNFYFVLTRCARDWILLSSFAKVSSFEDASSEILKREICRVYEALSRINSPPNILSGQFRFPTSIVNYHILSYKVSKYSISFDEKL